MDWIPNSPRATHMHATAKKQRLQFVLGCLRSSLAQEPGLVTNPRSAFRHNAQRGSRVGIMAGPSAPFIAKRLVFLFSCLVARAPGSPVSHARLGFLPQLAPAEMRPKHFTQMGVVLKLMQGM